MIYPCCAFNPEKWCFQASNYDSKAVKLFYFGYTAEAFGADGRWEPITFTHDLMRDFLAERVFSITVRDTPPPPPPLPDLVQISLF